MKRLAYRNNRSQGAALIVALILLMVMSLLGLSSIRATSTQEKMSANVHDRSLAFQAAENALRIGEQEAQQWGENAGSGAYPDIDTALASNNACTQTACNENGLCQIPDPDCSTARWNDPNQIWKATDAMEGLSGTPQYIVEALSTTAPCDPSEPTAGMQNCKRFRITARSTATGRASVTLQSIYATD
ncbi:pilus assembly PilX family protein [Parazoarcus communis]|uniref:Pilus assembly protein n=1 Tax=Parazoarcus communis SWub3 = DSM 12120 TaxID=1121029 RepID=A0A323UTG2_9RHOO|nr:PilX N-terminal domain-containing pilus assembly protein [Parazoarcus communis]NMG70547.1 pilus assembly protein [Parazoarcus communis SWub3 = DSM 12120]PZA15794.1 pilus assembly protein [Azoarcus communis] [Parazoarcus communis SWub3 = DSM 12120]